MSQQNRAVVHRALDAPVDFDHEKSHRQLAPVAVDQRIVRAEIYGDYAKALEAAAARE
jgi:hypothetical protein